MDLHHLPCLLRWREHLFTSPICQTVAFPVSVEGSGCVVFGTVGTVPTVSLGDQQGLFSPGQGRPLAPPHSLLCP